MERTLRVAFLTGSDNESTRSSVEAVCSLPLVRPVALLLDTERPGSGRSWKNLRRNLRRHGFRRYLIYRTIRGLRELSDSLMDRPGPSPDKVGELLRKAFPSRSFSLADLGRKFDFPIHAVANLNDAEAIRLLRECGADLGIVLGTRVLKPATFEAPALGCINLHKGKVPEYRGLPPGFWEIYDGAAAAGVTVHFIDKGLDTGDIVATAEVSILTTDTPDTLVEKLHREGAKTLAAAVAAIQNGAVQRRPQPTSPAKARVNPTLMQVEALRKRLPQWRPVSDFRILAKNLHCLLIYYSGLYSLTRALRGLRPGRAAVLLYHRVNDFARDALTVDTMTFAAQLLAISRRYRCVSTSALVDNVRAGKGTASTSVAIHFDDCYRDVWTNAAPILSAAGFPATSFISSGYVDTDRSFAHDRAKHPFQFENLRSAEVRAWAEAGFEIGAHTVNHVDLGSCALAEAQVEIVESKRQLEHLILRPVQFFSFPFGGINNTRKEVAGMVHQAGYAALFSAHGGFVGRATSLYDIPRIGVSHEKPLHVLLEIEGLSPRQLGASLKRFLR